MSNHSSRALAGVVLVAAFGIGSVRLSAQTPPAADPPRNSPQVTAGSGGFSLQSSDGQFRLRLRGYVQSDGRFFLDDEPLPGVDTFLLRRVRPIVEATMYRIFDVRIMPDFAGGTTVLQDAYIDMRFRPFVKLRAGKFKAPFGFERLMSATELLFIERALPTALVPNRDLGLMVHGDIASGNVAYAAGVFNGAVDGGSVDADLEDGKDVVARVFVQPFRSRRDSRWRGLGAGVAVSHGEHHGLSSASAALPTFRTAGQAAFFGFGGETLADGASSRISAQGHYYVGSFGIMGEHVFSSQEVRRQAARETLDNSAWQVAGSWVLTGETPGYRSVTPRSAFDPGAGTWGAIEVAARYSALDIDRDAFPLFAGATAARGARAWTTGLNWYLNPVVKLQVNFERMTFTAAGTTRRPAENGLLTRVQFAF